ncbi:SusC/RagA family TonB-linked outer membrane protein [uncultured Bacteroides sp.]|uniref:SusC/RagA family TonB-linked outer membrane protein n=1 Tax=uncultured Bacteroides sp. TaxID=162156 RepID=UPI002AAA770E|nr:SusC/RagA family TonB-linked outer membrane protein [uncultured Bacteroides sp.]
MKRNFCLLFVFFAALGLFVSSLANAAGNSEVQAYQNVQQTKKISGTVVDSKGEPVIGASILVKGTNKGTITDVDGKFSLNASQGAILVVSYVGYTKKEVAVKASAVYDIVLSEDAQALSEVVVTAMGIKKEKKALGYAVSDINSQELMKNKQTNVVNSLAGKIPGVNITQAGGAAGAGSNIVIRGGNSASEDRDNQPLFVVDGIVYDNSTVNAGNSSTDGVTKNATTFSNRVMDINPEDIQSMSVLKGAAASALYGSRAANGVIIITTKKGAEGTTRVNFSSKYSYSWANRLPEQQSTYGRGFYNEAGVFSDYTTDSWGKKIDGAVYNNIDNFFRGSNVYDNSVSVAGGSKNGSFYLSASNFDQSGIVPTTGYNKTTFRFNGEQKYGVLTVGANVSFSQADTKKTLTSGGLYDHGGNGAMTALYGWARSDDMKHYLNDNGTKYRMFEGLQELADDVENPYWILNKNKMSDSNSRFTGALNASLKLTDWWDVSSRVGIDRYTIDSYTYTAPGGAVVEKYQDGYLSKGAYTYQYITTNVMSNMHKTIKDFDLNFLVGTSTESTKTASSSHWGYNFETEGTISFNNISSDNQFFKDRTSRHRLVGVYSELRAAYKNIAYLTVTGRNDWSSTLPVSNRSYFYPSVSGSFVFTELLPKNDILSFGKVRASWAQVGKDASAYATNTYLRSVATLNGGTIGVGNDWTGGNDKLKPEIQSSYELGTELRFLNGRLGLDYTYYYSKTKNQLCSPRLAQSTGYIFLTLNGGSVLNKGMELSITGKPVVTKDFQWEATLNLSGNRGRLGDFIQGVDVFYVTDAQVGGVKAGSIPNGGYFLGLTGNKWMRETNTSGNEISNGRYIIDQTTGLYKDSKVETNVVGNREPTMIGGLNNSLTYKNFNLSFLFDLRLGGDIYNGTEYYLSSKGLSNRTLNRESVTFTGVVNTGTAAAPTYEEKTITYDGDKTYTVNGAQKSGRYMIQQYWDAYNNNAYNFITKTNWIRLRSVSLSYDFKDLLKKQNLIKGLSATLTGTNLLLITNYKGLDPETCASGSGTGGSGSAGIDYCGVPATAGVSFGVNLTF